ncbi:efflux RND transporter periplasmic adaptor subunit [Metabacillus litoralis]|uniref:efflux RND transporter periplasmic adaptor subunit n=1 Tax=Metabacillus litoralis TaxID=152268 RepID=UPI001CFCDB1D|nr:biotin/lipoyl-binding protein [Metabacillus litoralis]
MKLSNYLKLTSICFGSVLILGGCALLPKEQEALAPPLIEPAATKYETETVKRIDLIDSYEGKAEFQSTNSVDVLYRELGQRIKEVHVEPNQSVKKGDLLIELEQGDLAFQIQQQQIALSEAKLQVEGATVRKNEQEKLQSEINKLKDEQDKLNKEIKNMNNKLKKTASEQKILELQATLATLEQEQQQNEQEINMKEPQKLNISDLKREIQLAELNVKRQQNQLDDYRAKLDATKITAPITGIITSLADLKAGNTIEPFDTLLTISDPSSLRLVSKPKDRVEELSVGMAVIVTIDNQELSGEIFDLPDKNAPEKNISIEVTDIPSSVDLGKQADIRVVFDIRENAITIPSSAIRNYEEQQVVRILDGDNLTEVGVQTGLEANKRVEVISGLEEGDQIILR